MDGTDNNKSSSTPAPAISGADTLRDIFLWRRKCLSLMVLIMSTATWLLLEVYQFNFITVASWVAMTIVSLLFAWGNILRLLGKEPPNLSGLEISEKSAFEAVSTCRAVVEVVVKWMFHVSVEREWYVFAQVVVGILLLSYVGTFFDLLTLVYTGTVMGMTIPITYQKYNDKIKRFREWVELKSRRLYEMVDEKVIKKMKNKIVKEKKDKKIE